MKSAPINAAILLLLAVAALAVPTRSWAFETTAAQAILLDFDTGAVLIEKNASTPMFPASMTKIMTAYLTFERLREGSLAMTDTFRVSEKAWAKGGSKMFVDVGGDVSVADLLRGVIVQSGNDASIVLAEGIAGSEDAFGTLMTDKAFALGMTDSMFVNATGWPDDNHVTTARDLAILATAMIRDFPDYYALFGETEFSYNGIDQSNRNPLLFLDVGADGLKTGHTEASGYGLAASATRGDRRLVLVVNGLASERERSSESARLMGWGFANFNNYDLFAAGETVEEVAVWMGEADTV
ncbi:MAG: D-alanyl-D-alanine carboxypeptidase, partial [Alphaproteobacteria bacterium]|nr:D-alanyl-D-alanine carboxypeptidase [Alphaproteobacteria bacterium]